MWDFENARGKVGKLLLHEQDSANHLKIGGYKIFWTAPLRAPAWMTKPYLGGDADYKGYPIYDDATVEGFMGNALKGAGRFIAPLATATPPATR